MAPSEFLASACGCAGRSSNRLQVREPSLRRRASLQRNELGPLLGQLPLPPGGGPPPPRTLRYSPRFGSLQHAGGDKLVMHIDFEDVTQGAPALLKWLRQRGCRDFKYEFASVGLAESEEDE